MQGLTPQAQVIYLRGLRRYMDYRTGIVGGPRRKVNYQSLVELITPDRDWGSNRREPPPTKAYVRARIQELKRSGLIEDVGSSKDVGLILRLPLADIDSVRLEKEQHRNDTDEDGKEQHRSSTGNYEEYQEDSREIREGSNTGNDTPHTPRSNTHPVTGKDLPYHHRAHEAWPDERIPKTPVDWASFFGVAGPYAAHIAMHAKAIPMYANWCERRVTCEVVRWAMTAATTKLGKAPDGPTYLRNFVDDILESAERLIEEQESRQQRNQTHGNATGPHRDQGSRRRLSTVEAASRAAEVYIQNLQAECEDEGHGGQALAANG